MMRPISAITMVMVLTGICAAQYPTATKKQTPNAKTEPAEIESMQEPTIRARSTVVLAPTLVKDAKGEVIYGLTANDFIVTDDGVEQRLRLDETPAAEPVSLVVVIQKGGRADYEFD